MKVAVIGRDGQLARSLADAFGQNAGNWKTDFLGREQVTADNSLHPLLETQLNSMTPDLIINCAAYTAVDKAESEPERALLINGILPEFLAAYSAEKNCRFIHISTDFVFSGEKNTPYDEEDTCAPLGIYGTTKREGEIRIVKRNPAAMIIRTSWLYSLYGSNFLLTMLKLMDSREEIGVVCDQEGTPTATRDLAQALLIVAARNEAGGGIYHFSSLGTATWFDFAWFIARAFDKKTVIRPITTAEYPTPAKRPAYSVLSTRKIRESFSLSIPHWFASLTELRRQYGG